MVAVVLTVLQLPHAESSLAALSSGFKAIINLAVGNAANKIQLGRLGACRGDRLLSSLTFILSLELA